MRQRQHQFAISAEDAQAVIDAQRDAADAADRRFGELCTALLRKMPADHAALKAAVRELRECRWASYHNHRDVDMAWATRDYGRNQHEIALPELQRLVRCLDYRYHYTRRKDRPYIDLAVAHIAHLVEGAIFLLNTLLNSRAMRIAGDEQKEASK